MHRGRAGRRRGPGVLAGRERGSDRRPDHRALLGGVTTGVTGVVSGVLGGTSPRRRPATSPVTTGTGNGGLTVGVGGTTVGVTTGNGVGVTVGTGNSSGLGVAIGSTSGGTTAVVGVTNPTTTTTPTDTSTTAPASTPVTLSALSAVAQYKTVYPAKDGYRDTVNFTLNGTASDGQQHVASGVAKLTYGSSTVATWPITATNQVINWNGLKGGKILPGHYVFTATIGSGTSNGLGHRRGRRVREEAGTSTTSLLSAKSVSGKHKMAAKPLAGLKNGKVSLRIISVRDAREGQAVPRLQARGQDPQGAHPEREAHLEADHDPEVLHDLHDLPHLEEGHREDQVPASTSTRTSRSSSRLSERRGRMRFASGPFLVLGRDPRETTCIGHLDLHPLSA